MVGAADMYDGLATAAQMFADSAIARFEIVQRLHIALLVITLAFGLLFILKLFRPHIREAAHRRQGHGGDDEHACCGGGHRGHRQDAAAGHPEDTAATAIRGLMGPWPTVSTAST